MLLNKAYILISFCLIVGLNSCRRDPLRVDLSGIDVEVNIKRLDRDLFEVTPLNEKEKIPLLIREYGDFFQLYNYKVIQLGNPMDEGYSGYLQSFLTHPATVETKLKVDSVFEDVENLEKEITRAFRYYKYYFPDKIVPDIYTCISGFNQSIVLGEKILGISLDKYLGEDCEFYKRLALPGYKRINMYPEKIVTDAIQAWILSEMTMGEDKHSLIDNMIYQGKVMYFMDALFVDYPDWKKIGFTAEQLEWCKDHEALMWTYLIEKRLLYSSDRMEIRRYTGPAPFSAGFTEESPGRAGIWIGWQIVREYMRKNPDLGLQDLLKENDCQKILAISGYSPH